MLFNKIIMYACRYWPENDEEAKNEAAGMSLEALHQLASQRAEARRKSECKVAICGISEIVIICWIELLGTALTDDTNEVDRIRETKLHKRKRKKKSRQAEVQETDDNKVTLSDTEEQMKQLTVSEVDYQKTDSKSGKRKKKRSLDKSSPLKDSYNAMVASADGREIDEMEDSTHMKKKKHQKKMYVEPTAYYDYEEQATQLYDAEIVDGEFSQRDQGSDVIVSHSEGEGASQEDIMDTQTTEVIEDDQTVPLMPLGHGGKTAKEKKTVQRQLPQWITEADIIPDDITEQSR